MKTELPTQVGSWREPLVALAQEVLDALTVPYDVQELEKVVREEYELAFQLTPDWPDHLSPVQIPDAKLVDKQVAALRGVLAAHDVWVDLADADFEALRRASSPVVVILREADPTAGRLAILCGISACGESVRYRLPGGPEVRAQAAELAVAWTGLVLTFRSIAERRTSAFIRRRRTAALLLAGRSAAVAVGLTAVAAAIAHTPAVGRLVIGGAAAYAALKLAGLFVCVAIFRVERRVKTGTVGLQQLCTLHRSFSCERVLASKGARLLGVLSLSDVGFVYFVATLTFLGLAFVVEGAPEAVALLALLSVAALPLTVFSIVYQAAVVRAWCPLCLAVQGILWLEAGVAVWAWRAEALLPPTLGSAALGAITVLATSFAFLRERERDAARWHARNARARLSVLQRNAEAFSALLQAGPSVDDRPLAGDLVMGGEEAPVRILALLDPQCHRCAHCFADLRRLAQSLPDLFQVRARIVAEFTPLRTAEDVVALVEVDPAAAEELLARWYRHVLDLLDIGQIGGSGEVTQSVYSRWRESSGRGLAVTPSEAARAAFEGQLGWERERQITGWPAVFVNGFAWPPYYHRWRHLLYFAEEIADLPGGAAIEESGPKEMVDMSAERGFPSESRVAAASAEADADLPRSATKGVVYASSEWNPQIQHPAESVGRPSSV